MAFARSSPTYPTSAPDCIPPARAQLGSAEMEVTRAGDREGRLRAALEEARRETELLERALQDGQSREQASQGTIAALTDTVREMRDTSLVRVGNRPHRAPSRR